MCHFVYIHWLLSNVSHDIFAGFSQRYQNLPGKDGGGGGIAS